MVTLAVVLGSLLFWVRAAPDADDIFGPLFISRDREGPLLVVREQSAPPLIAIRLSIPVEESPGLAGAGRVLQLLIQERAQAEVDRFGGRLELTRTPSHLVYAVAGPAIAFGEMVAVLKYAVAPPQSVLRAPNAVWLTARREALAEFETPDLLIRRRLEAALFPALAAGQAGPELGDLPSSQELEWFWQRWFRPSQMSVIVVGPIGAEVARAAFRGWPEPPSPRARSTPIRTTEALPGPEVISARAGLGYPAGAAEPAALAIAAALVEESLPELDLRQAVAELWWAAGRTALVVIGAAPASPPASAAALRTSLQLAVATVASRANVADLERVRRRLRHSLLIRARTPGGLASVLGEFLDRTGEPGSAGHFLRTLGEIDDDEVRRTLRTLIYQPPIVVELQP
jgi:hypothetical protein